MPVFSASSDFAYSHFCFFFRIPIAGETDRILWSAAESQFNLKFILNSTSTMVTESVLIGIIGARTRRQRQDSLVVCTTKQKQMTSLYIHYKQNSYIQDLLTRYVKRSNETYPVSFRMLKQQLNGTLKPADCRARFVKQTFPNMLEGARLETHHTTCQKSVRRETKQNSI